MKTVFLTQQKKRKPFYKKEREKKRKRERKKERERKRGKKKRKKEKKREKREKGVFCLFPYFWCTFFSS